MPTDTPRHRAAETALVVACAAIVTLVMVYPVLRAPSTRVVGAEIAGRHHDPFTAMRQFTQSTDVGLYSQPLTDVPGRILAGAAGPVAGYSLLVLITFPLAAAAAFLLARHLGLSGGGAVFAALVFAFSPFHLAQSAYHPHVAQVQWIPLYLLVLWRCLERWSPVATIGLVLATAALALSNFYGAYITAVVTPVAAAAYWAVCVRGSAGAARSLVLTAATLAVIVIAGVGVLWWVAPAALANPAALAFDRSDLFTFSAKWWSYLVPPVINPWAGDTARHIWANAGVHEGLLEQQVTLGMGVVLLGVAAIGGWIRSRRESHRLRAVPVLVVVAFTALVCSLSPEREINGITVVRPSAWLYAVAPMFRSYARFGVVVQLMAALLAGIGIDALRRGGRIAQIVAAGLVVLTMAEYAAAPTSLSRDVLPTPAHRWVAELNAPVRALDCVPPDVESSSIPWLSEGRIAVLGGPVHDCYEPQLSGKLRALGFTHLIVRRSSPLGRWWDTHGVPGGLRLVHTEGDADVLQVDAAQPTLYIAEDVGFFETEVQGGRTWRWMEGTAAWSIVNTTQTPVRATLTIELEAFHQPRHLEVIIDGRLHQVLRVDPRAQLFETLPVDVAPGPHVVSFRAVEPPTVPDTLVHNGDTRRLSIAFGPWSWRIDPPGLSSAADNPGSDVNLHKAPGAPSR